MEIGVSIWIKVFMQKFLIAHRNKTNKHDLFTLTVVKRHAAHWKIRMAPSRIDEFNKPNATIIQLSSIIHGSGPYPANCHWRQQFTDLIFHDKAHNSNEILSHDNADAVICIHFIHKYAHCSFTICQRTAFF